MIPFKALPYNRNLVDGSQKVSYPNIGNNEVSTNESSQSYYAQHSIWTAQLGTLILGSLFSKLECSRMLWGYLVHILIY